MPKSRAAAITCLIAAVLLAANFCVGLVLDYAVTPLVLFGIGAIVMLGMAVPALSRRRARHD